MPKMKTKARYVTKKRLGLKRPNPKTVAKKYAEGAKTDDLLKEYDLTREELREILFEYKVARPNYRGSIQRWRKEPVDQPEKLTDRQLPILADEKISIHTKPKPIHLTIAQTLYPPAEDIEVPSTHGIGTKITVGNGDESFANLLRIVMKTGPHRHPRGRYEDWKFWQSR